MTTTEGTALLPPDAEAQAASAAARSSECLEQVGQQLTRQMVRHGQRRSFRQRVRGYAVQLLLLMATVTSIYLLWRREIDDWVQSPAVREALSQIHLDELKAWYQRTFMP